MSVSSRDKICMVQSMNELCSLVQQYHSCENFVNAIKDEYEYHQNQYKKYFYDHAHACQKILPEFSMIFRLANSGWFVFRHFAKMYFRMRGIQRPDAFYDRDGGLKFYYNFNNTFLDCENISSSMKQFAEEFYNNHLYYLNLYNRLADSKSKNVLFHILKARLTLNPAEYQKVADPIEQQYLDPELISLQDEVFCDIGAYTGDSAEILMNKYGSQIRKLYLYEPNHKNCIAAKKAMCRYRNRLQTDIVIRPCGVSNVNRKSYITQADSCSKVNNSGTGKEITLVTLDKDITEKVTFIKMDIEGSELDALKGSQQHILQDHPVLAICIYHKVQDIRTIIQWIQSQVPEYHLYIRHYRALSFADTVLYCIP